MAMASKRPSISSLGASLRLSTCRVLRPCASAISAETESWSAPSWLPGLPSRQRACNSTRRAASTTHWIGDSPMAMLLSTPPCGPSGNRHSRSRSGKSAKPTTKSTVPASICASTRLCGRRIRSAVQPIAFSADFTSRTTRPGSSASNSAPVPRRKAPAARSGKAIFKGSTGQRGWARHGTAASTQTRPSISARMPQTLPAPAAAVKPQPGSGGELDPVPPLVLGPVQRHIRPAEQGLGRLAGTAGARHADAGRDVQRSGGGLEGARRNGVAQPLAQALLGVGLGLRPDDRELLAAQAHRQVHRAQRLAQALADAAEHRVTDRMAKVVIDALEMVHVQQRQHGRMRGATLQHPADALVKTAPVQQAGQHVDLDQAADLPQCMVVDQQHQREGLHDHQRDRDQQPVGVVLRGLGAVDHQPGRHGQAAAQIGDDAGDQVAHHQPHRETAACAPGPPGRKRRRRDQQQGRAGLGQHQRHRKLAGGSRRRERGQRQQHGASQRPAPARRLAQVGAQTQQHEQRRHDATHMADGQQRRGRTEGQQQRPGQLGQRRRRERAGPQPHAALAAQLPGAAQRDEGEQGRDELKHLQQGLDMQRFDGRHGWAIQGGARAQPPRRRSSVGEGDTMLESKGWMR
mmetsp:Transcript_1043/g.2730  ORF Transcript_1043/g.2730 Transcript_1043/m.2730 type:complete len:632 (+) Transcript_1043:885-2780(+)